MMQIYLILHHQESVMTGVSHSTTKHDCKYDSTFVIDGVWQHLVRRSSVAVVTEQVARNSCVMHNVCICCKHEAHTLRTSYIFPVGLVVVGLLLSSIHEDKIHRDAYHNHMILCCHSISCCAFLWAVSVFEFEVRAALRSFKSSFLLTLRS